MHVNQFRQLMRDQMEEFGNSTGENMENDFFLISGCVVLALALCTCFSSGVLLFIIRNDPLRYFCCRPIVSFTVGSCSAHIFQGIFGVYFGISEILRANDIAIESRNVLDFSSFTAVVCAFLITYRVSLSISVMYERYLAYRFAHLHRRLVTKRSVSVLHVLLAVALSLFSAVPFLPLNRKAYLLFYVHAFITAPIIALFVNVGLQYWNMRHMNRVSATNKDIPLRTERVLKERKRGVARSRKFIGIALRNMTLLFVSTLPWYTLMLEVLHVHENLSTVISKSLLQQRMAVAFTFVEAVITPLIYIWNPDYRKSAKYIWARWRRG